MSIADLILSEISKNDIDRFSKLRSKFSSSLSQPEFKELIKLIENDPIFILSNDLTYKENHVLSKVLLKCKIRNPSELTEFLINENSKRTPLLLNTILIKGCKMDYALVNNYINRVLNGLLYQLIFAVNFLNYVFITVLLKKFCNNLFLN